MTDSGGHWLDDAPWADALGRSFPTDEHRARYAAKVAWERAGVDPYGARFAADASAGEIVARFAEYEGKRVRVAGRVMAKRGQGKAAFFDLRDRSGRIQLFCNVDHLGAEALERLERWTHAGDFLGVEGEAFRTKRGEISIRVEAVTFLSKALEPMPEKWHGLQDIELRSRHRYLDLIANEHSLQTFLLRSKVIQTIRTFLYERGYVEVETPVLIDVASGAAARPFTTHHNALDADLHLRISLELPLKKAMIGGIERVFEIGRIFRNEGIDRDHNPEFTMIELYEAYSDYEGMMAITEEMFARVATDCLGSLQLTLSDGTPIDLTPPWPRKRYTDLLREHAGFELTPETTVEELRARIAQIEGVDLSDVNTRGRAIDLLFSNTVEDHLSGPVIVKDYPIELSPLAKRIPGEPHLTYRFEAYIRGMEMGNAFSELNDPEEQRRRFAQQAEERAAGDDEAMALDEDFLFAMNHGMPPAGGLGIGIDRMVMVLGGIHSIRDVILFPLMKEERKEEEAVGFFERLQAAMAQRGVSPGKLMKELPVSKAEFNAWKKGEGEPSAAQWEALERMLGVHPSHPPQHPDTSHPPQPPS